ncbi:MAG: gliding motility-associated C-terminal domain-containing protein [Bacteroidia bacterium]|nr:gliding motility-associated C-terminal domain-containing protein [Bacteroidia bacterium]
MVRKLAYTIRILLVVGLFFSIKTEINAQSIFKGITDIHGGCGVRSLDGKYVVMLPYSANGNIVFAVLDSTGDVLTSPTYPMCSWPALSNSHREPRRIIALSDTSFVGLYYDTGIRCFGIMRFKPGNGILYDIQIDTAKTYYPSQTQNGEKMLIDDNGDLLVLLPLEKSILSTSTGAHFTLCRFNPNTGSLISSRCYGGLKQDHPASMIHTQGNGLLLIGSTSLGMVPGTSIAPQGRIVKLDAQDSVQWTLIFVDTNAIAGTYPQAATELANGDFLVIGNAYSNHSFLCRISNSGNIIWSKTISGTSSSWSEIELIAPDKIVLTGVSQPNGWDPTTTIAELDTAGNFIRGMAYGTQQFDYGKIVYRNTATGTYTLIGYSQNVFSSGLDGVTFIQTDANLSAGCHSIPITVSSSTSYTKQMMNPQMARIETANTTNIPYQRSIVTLTTEVVCAVCIANAGQDQNTCLSTATLTGNQPNGNSGIWTQVSGPITVTIQSPSAATTTITGMTQAGNYAFAWHLNGTGCQQPNDTVVIHVSPVPKPFIGNDTTVCAGSSFLIGAQTLPPNLTIRWKPAIYLSDSTIARPTFTGITPQQSSITQTYIMTVSSGTNCFASDTIQITINPADSVFLLQKTNPNCNGAQNGELEVKFNSGTIPIQYQWSSGQIGSHITGLQAGNYQVTATDANGCVAKARFILSNPPSISAQIQGLAPSCNQNNGWLKIASLQNATLPVTYSWNTGSTADSVMGLNAGYYKVTIQDIKGCTLTWDTTLTVISPFNVQVNIREISCIGDSNGQISLNITQGLPPYTVQWNNGTSGTVLSNLASGSYSCTISDATGCTINRQFTLNPPPKIDTTFSRIIAPACFGEATGSIRIGVTAGTRSFTVRWQDGQTGLSRQNIPAGTYIATVTDTMGCQKRFTFVVPNGANLTYTTSVNQISCIGVNDGSITISPHGGTPPYSFLWSNGSTQPSISNLNQGIYRITITESGGCSKRDSFTINNPTPLISNAQVVPVHCTEITNNGSIHLYPSGANPPIRVVWENGDTNQLRENLTNGWYRFTLSNTRGCTTRDSIYVPVLPPPNPRILTTPALPAQMIYGQEVSLTIQNPQAQSIYRWIIGDLTLVGSNVSFRAERTGTYSVSLEATDSLGCQTVIPCGIIVIQADHHVYVPTGFSPNGDQKNDTWTIITTGTKQFDIKLFNRWGMLVFHSTETQPVWDGKLNGEDAPEGVYVWYYESTGFDKSIKVETGTLSLIR